jgi:TPR repeat protein
METQVLKAFNDLEIPPTSSMNEVKVGYRRLVKAWHPDRFENNQELRKKAEEILRLLNLAYERLEQYFNTCPSSPESPKMEDGISVHDAFVLAERLLKTDGATENIPKGLVLLQRAANAGYDKAQHFLAELYFKGRHVGKDIDRAIKYWRASAEQKNPLSQYQLGCGFFGLLGPFPNFDGIEAYKWLNLATTWGVGEARVILDSVNLSWKGINKARSLASHLYQAYAETSVDALGRQWFRLFRKEFATNANFKSQYNKIGSHIDRFSDLEGDVSSELSTRLRDIFHGNASSSAGRFIGSAFSWNKRLIGMNWDRTDLARILSVQMCDNAAEHHTSMYLCAREHVLNQLWLKLKP